MSPVAAAALATLFWATAENLRLVFDVPTVLYLAPALLAGVGLGARQPAVLQLGLFGTALVWAMPYLPRAWVGIPGVPLLTFTVMTLLGGRLLGHSAPWWRTLRLGRVDRTAWFWCVTTIVTAGVALLLWASWTDTLERGMAMMRAESHRPAWLMVVLALPAISVLNAVSEELAYRGIVQDAAESAFPTQPWVANAIQASTFAALHFSVGFPNGWVGYGMALAWGGMLGYLRRRTGGLAVPVIVHIGADLVIFYYLYFRVVT
ncbi:MAG: CPBP family intramembrane glutamic endopeptidase [Myxococcota bacterium]